MDQAELTKSEAALLEYLEAEAEIPEALVIKAGEHQMRREHASAAYKRWIELRPEGQDYDQAIGALVRKIGKLPERESLAQSAPPKQKPSVGRIVHYQSYGTPGGEYLPQPRAAIIAAVVDDEAGDLVDLVVLNPGGLFFNRCKQAPDDVPKPGCWNWPPRV